MAEASVPLTPSTAPARLNAPWNNIGRVVWWVFAIAAVGLLIASIPAYVSQIGIMTEYEISNVRNIRLTSGTRRTSSARLAHSARPTTRVPARAACPPDR